MRFGRRCRNCPERGAWVHFNRVNRKRPNRQTWMRLDQGCRHCNNRGTWLWLGQGCRTHPQGRDGVRLGHKCMHCPVALLRFSSICRRRPKWQAWQCFTRRRKHCPIRRTWLFLGEGCIAMATGRAMTWLALCLGRAPIAIFGSWHLCFGSVLLISGYLDGGLGWT